MSPREIAELWAMSQEANHYMASIRCDGLRAVAKAFLESERKLEVAISALEEIISFRGATLVGGAKGYADGSQYAFFAVAEVADRAILEIEGPDAHKDEPARDGADDVEGE